MECLKLINVLKSTFLGSEFHTECLIIKMKKNKKNSAPRPYFLPDCNRKHKNFLRPYQFILLGN